MYLESKSRQQKVTKPLHPPAFHLYSHLYHFHNIWMFNHPLTTKYHLFFSLRLLGDKIFHCVIGEEFLKLTIQLGCQCFIVCNNQCRFVHLLDNVCHGKGLTRSGDTKQRLTLVSFFKSFDQFFDCLWLITGWVIL